jgi:hypothetical protein
MNMKVLKAFNEGKKQRFTGYAICNLNEVCSLQFKDVDSVSWHSCIASSYNVWGWVILFNVL